MLSIVETVRQTPLQPPVLAAPCLGYAAIIRAAYAGINLSDMMRDLVDQVQAGDAGAMLDLATLLMLQGGDLALEGRIMQRGAVARQQTYEISHGSGLGLRILAFVTVGDFMANTPIDFLLHGSDAVLLLHFVDGNTVNLCALPAHDVAFMAIGESPENAAALVQMAHLLAHWPGPVFNRNTAAVARLTRDGVSRMLADQPAIVAPLTHRLSVVDLAAVAVGARPLASLAAGLDFPAVLRPIGTHAGHGMARIDGVEALANWMRGLEVGEVFAAPFVDYRGADGLYAKQRIVLVQGQPFASHLAASVHWMVHYLNADMADHPDRRQTEAAWMAAFDTDFARRHAESFAALHRLVGLDYFGMDCTELPDGRLLVFELDVAMIVHDMDSAAVFPYKKPAMQKLFAGFLAALESASNR